MTACAPEWARGCGERNEAEPSETAYNSAGASAGSRRGYGEARGTKPRRKGGNRGIPGSTNGRKPRKEPEDDDGFVGRWFAAVKCKG